jgi:hypothetical protein
VIFARRAQPHCDNNKTGGRQRFGLLLAIPRQKIAEGDCKECIKLLLWASHAISANIQAVTALMETAQHDPRNRCCNLHTEFPFCDQAFALRALYAARLSPPQDAPEGPEQAQRQDPTAPFQTTGLFRVLSPIARAGSNAVNNWGAAIFSSSIERRTTIAQPGFAVM